MAQRGGLLLGVVGFNLVLLTVDRYTFGIHLPISKWKPYLKNDFFRQLKGMDNIHKGYGNVKSTWKIQGNFLSEKSGNPVSCFLWGEQLSHQNVYYMVESESVWLHTTLPDCVLAIFSSSVHCMLSTVFFIFVMYYLMCCMAMWMSQL